MTISSPSKNLRHLWRSSSNPVSRPKTSHCKNGALVLIFRLFMSGFYKRKNIAVFFFVFFAFGLLRCADTLAFDEKFFKRDEPIEINGDTVIYDREKQKKFIQGGGGVVLHTRTPT